MRWRSPRWGLWLLAAALALVGLWHAAVKPLAPLARLEWAADDIRLTALMRGGLHPSIVILDIDEASLAEYGQWPWPRDRLAKALNTLFSEQGIAALGFDFVFAEPDHGGWEALAEALAGDEELAAFSPKLAHALNHDGRFAQALQGRPVVLGYYLTADRGGVRSGNLPAPGVAAPPLQKPKGLPEWNGWGANVAELARAAPRAGFFNSWPDADGMVRSVPAVAWVDGALRLSLAMELARLAAGDPMIEAVRSRNQQLSALDITPTPRAGASALSTRLALDELGRLRVPYRGTGGKLGGQFRYLSAADVLSHRLNPGELKGQIVIVGSSAPGLADLRATPVNTALPGVEVHASLLAGLLDGWLPQRPDWAPGFEALFSLLGVGVALWAVLKLAAPQALLLGVTWTALAIAGNAAAYLWAQRVLPIAVPLLLGGVLFAAGLSLNYLREWRRRRSLAHLFGSYVPRARAQALALGAGDAPLEAHNAELTILFCDLRGFTSLAEGLAPLALRELLNLFLSTATEAIHGEDGTLDKFIGDAVMAFWNAPEPQPDHAARAVRAARALLAAQPALNAELAARGLPSVDFGLGLASGMVCVGDLGSSERRAYTAVGDSVNLAARLEALTRDVGVALLVAQSTQTAAAAACPELSWIEIDAVQVKGRSQPVTLFTPIASALLAHGANAEQSRLWHLALHAARQHDRGLAQQLLAQLAAASPAPPIMTPRSPLLTSCADPDLAALWPRLAARLQARLAAQGARASA